MKEIETERLVIKTNIISAKELEEIYTTPMEESNKIDIFAIKPTEFENGNFFGFRAYLKETSEKVCKISFATKTSEKDKKTYRAKNEIDYGTEDKFQNQGYMSEALKAVIMYIKDNKIANELNALISNNSVSEKILLANDFKCITDKGNEKWYKLELE